MISLTLAVAYRVFSCRAVGRFPLLCTLPKPPSVFFYHWNKWTCWSHSALRSRGNIRSLSSAGFHGNAQLHLPKCSQYSRNVLDEATKHWITFVCFILFQTAWGRTMYCICFVHKPVIHVTSGFFWLKYMNMNVNRNIIIQAGLEHICYDGSDNKGTIKANIIHNSFNFYSCCS